MDFKVILCLFLISIIVEIAITKIIDNKNKREEQELKNRCSFQVNAVCVHRYVVKHNIDSHKLDDYFVIWQFNINNQIYNIESKVKRENFAEIGESAILYVNPYNIQEYVKVRTVEDEKRLKVVQRNVLLFLLFCAVFSLIGIIAIYC